MTDPDGEGEAWRDRVLIHVGAATSSPAGLEVAVVVGGQARAVRIPIERLAPSADPARGGGGPPIDEEMRAWIADHFAERAIKEIEAADGFFDEPEDDEAHP